MNAPKPGTPTVGKAYRLLHAILATAVEDELIDRNPCVLRGASKETAVERPIATIDQVFALADAIDPSLRMMVLVAGFTGLRLGELRALRRGRIDLGQATIKVVEQYQELASGELFLGPPKSAAGHRTVSLPAALIPDLQAHLEWFVRPGEDSIVFSGTLGQPLHRKTFYRHWTRALAGTGMRGFRFHDLRHTANTLSASTGASTKELMARMGHSSARAALIYQHATRERDAAIASHLSRLIDERMVDAGAAAQVHDPGRGQVVDLS
jgi:integrase